MSDDGGERGFDSPLDDLFVQGASIKEPSAAEREAEARAARLAEVRSLREHQRSRRREQRRKALRPLFLIGVVVGLAALLYVLFPSHKGSSTAVPKLPNHVTVYYAVPSDARPDPNLPAAIRHDVAVAQDWLASQTGGHVLRVDERDGEVAVQMRRLSATTQELANVLSAAGLVTDGFVPRDGSNLTTIPLVFVPVTRQTVGDLTDCGVTNNGVAVVWAGSCGLRPSTNSAWPGGDTRVIVHELLHALGAVPTCAPHYGHTGHVIDTSSDIMYWDAEKSGGQFSLDPGHDDYYGTGSKTCWDVARHPAWKKR